MLAGLAGALAARRRAADATAVTATGGRDGPPSPAALHAPRVPGAPVGLRNSGSLCYLNSLLQVLFAIPAFHRGVLALPTPPDTRRSVAAQLQALFASLQLSDRGAVETKALQASFGWRDGEASVQNDAHECLTVLLEAINREAPAGTPLSAPLDGHTEAYVRCLACGGESVREEPFSSLTLPVSGCPTVAAAVARVLEAETLTGDNAYACDRCGGKRDARKGVRFVAAGLPPALLVHLNRYEFDASTLTRRKVTDRLVPDAALELPTGDGGPGVAYRLAAVAMHLGTAGSGHYFAYLRRPAAWLSLNDSACVALTAAQARDALGDAAALDVDEAGASASAAASPPPKSASPRVGAMAAAPPAPPVPVPAAPAAPAAGRAVLASDAARGAYLLLYVREDAWGDFCAGVGAHEVPPALRDAVEADNAEYRDAWARHVAQRARWRFRVFCAAATAAAAASSGGTPRGGAPSATMARPPHSPLSPGTRSVEVIMHETEDASTLLTAAVAAIATSTAAAAAETRGGGGDACASAAAAEERNALHRLRRFDVGRGVPLAPLPPFPPTPTPLAAYAASAGAGAPVLASGDALFLEARESADVPWPRWRDNDAEAFAVAASPWQGAGVGLGAPIAVPVAPGETTVGALRAACAAALRGRREAPRADGEPTLDGRALCLTLLRTGDEPGGGGVPAATLLADDDAVIVRRPGAAASARGFAPSSGPTAPAVPVGPAPTRPLPPRVALVDDERIACCSATAAADVAQWWDASVHAVAVSVTPTPVPAHGGAPLPPAPAARVPLSLSIDRRAPLSALRAAVAAALGMDACSFKLRDAATGAELKDGARPIGAPAGGSGGGGAGGAIAVTVEAGRPLEAGEYALRVVVATAAAESDAAGGGADGATDRADDGAGGDAPFPLLQALPPPRLAFAPVGVVVLRGSVSVGAAKVEVVQQLGSAAAAAAAAPAGCASSTAPLPRYFRLRERDAGGAALTRLYADGASLLRAAGGRLWDGKEVVLQALAAPEPPVGDGDVIVRLCRWRPCAPAAAAAAAAAEGPEAGGRGTQLSLPVEAVVSTSAPLSDACSGLRAALGLPPGCALLLAKPPAWQIASSRGGIAVAAALWRTPWVRVPPAVDAVASDAIVVLLTTGESTSGAVPPPPPLPAAPMSEVHRVAALPTLVVARSSVGSDAAWLSAASALSTPASSPHARDGAASPAFPRASAGGDGGGVAPGAGAGATPAAPSSAATLTSPPVCARHGDTLVVCSAADFDDGVAAGWREAAVAAAARGTATAGSGSGGARVAEVAFRIYSPAEQEERDAARAASAAVTPRASPGGGSGGLGDRPPSTAGFLASIRARGAP